MYSSQTCDFYSQLGKCLKRPHPLQVEHFWQESPHLILHLCEAFFQRCFMNLQLIRNDSPAFICLANRRPVFIVGGARHWSDPSTGLFNNPPHPPPPKLKDTDLVFPACNRGKCGFLSSHKKTCGNFLSGTGSA